MAKEQITTAVEEAARLLRENPTWTYQEAIEKAKKMVADEGDKTIEKTN